MHDTHITKSALHSTGLQPAKDAFVWVPAGMELSRLINGLPRGLRGFGWCERQSGRRIKPEPASMPNAQVEKSNASRKTISSQRSPRGKKPPPGAAEDARAKTPRVAAPPPRTTKQELVLTLLSRPQGASVIDIMQATDWQMHSVRGFFAGTVKKKLGFTLTSSKTNDEVR